MPRINSCVFSYNPTGIPQSLLKEWLQDMLVKPDVLRSPIMDHVSCNHVLLICQNFYLDTNTFILVVRILDKYILECSRQQKPLHDPLLHVMAAVLIASKMRAADYARWNWPHILMRHYRELLGLKRNINKRDIENLKAAEVQVLYMINFRLEIAYEYDDLEVVVYMYLRPLGLKDIMTTCDYLLQLYFLRGMEFNKLLRKRFKKIWLLRRVFRSRYFIPFVIILSAIQLMDSGYINLRRLTRAFANIAGFDEIYLNAATKMLLKNKLVPNNSVNASANTTIREIMRKAKLSALKLTRDTHMADCYYCGAQHFFPNGLYFDESD